MAPASKLGRGKPLRNQTKELLQKIYGYFESEIERDANSTVTAAQLVNHATGVSMNTLRRVLSEGKNCITIKKENKAKRRCKKDVVSNDVDAQSIRKIIHSFYTKDEEFPIMRDLYLILKADIDYQGALGTLRRHVANLGFKWVEKADNNSILLEKHDVRFARIQYLTVIEKYRAQGRNIVYTGEMAIERCRVSSKPKADGSSTILKQPAKSKVVILLAGDHNDLMKNSLFMFNGNKKDFKEECKGELFEQYEKWFRFHVIPNLKPSSIVVVDSGSVFHNRILNQAPHSNSRKKEMMDYLTARQMPYSSDMYKAQLYQLVLMCKDKYNDYKTDVLLREFGHTVLRLPPHYPDFNPVRHILATLQQYTGKDCLPNESLMKIAKEKVYSTTSDEWRHACRCVEVEENSLKATDKVIDEISECTFRNIDDGSDDSDEENASEQESMDSD